MRKIKVGDKVKRIAFGHIDYPLGTEGVAIWIDEERNAVGVYCAGYIKAWGIECTEVIPAEIDLTTVPGPELFREVQRRMKLENESKRNNEVFPVFHSALW